MTTRAKSSSSSSSDPLIPLIAKWREKACSEGWESADPGGSSFSPNPCVRCGWSREDHARRERLTSPTADPSPVFVVGDVVQVLNAIRLPKVEQVIHTGRIERITQGASGNPLYWISGIRIARSARVLRHAPIVDLMAALKAALPKEG